MMKKKGKGLAFLLALVLLMTCFTGCGGEDSVSSSDGESGRPSYPDQGVTEDTIYMGSFQAQSGGAASLGVPITNGINAYVNYVNDNGGINGRKLVYLIEDDAYDPAKTVAVVKKLVEQDHVLAIGPALGAGGSLAVKEYLINKGVPFVHWMNGSSSVALPVTKTMFPVQPLYADEARFLVKFGVDALNTKKLAIIYANVDYGKDGQKGTIEACKNFGVEVVYEGSVDSADIDFSTQVQKAKEAGADTVVVYGILNIFSGVLKEANQQGYSPNWLTFYPNLDVSLHNLAGAEVIENHNIYITGWIPEPNPDDENYQKFVEIYSEYNNGEIPSGLATAGFAGAELIVEALRRAGEDLNRETFMSALETMDGFSGLQLPPVTYGEGIRTGVTSMQMYKAIPEGYKTVTEFVDLKDLDITYK